MVAHDINGNLATSFKKEEFEKEFRGMGEPPTARQRGAAAGPSVAVTSLPTYFAPAAKAGHKYLAVILAPGAPLMLSQFVFTVLGVTLRSQF